MRSNQRLGKTVAETQTAHVREMADELTTMAQGEPVQVNFKAREAEVALRFTLRAQLRAKELARFDACHQ